MATVDVSDILKDLSRKLFALIALSMNKMAEVSSCAARRTVIVSARDSPVVSRLYKLIRIWRWVSCKLCLFEFVSLLEFSNCVISEFN